MPYTRQEETDLLAGVAKYGTSWTSILRHYQFNRQRTAADLKEKYARIKKVGSISGWGRRNSEKIWGPTVS